MWSSHSISGIVLALWLLMYYVSVDRLFSHDLKVDLSPYGQTTFLWMCTPRSVDPPITLCVCCQSGHCPSLCEHWLSGIRLLWAEVLRSCLLFFWGGFVFRCWRSCHAIASNVVPCSLSTNISPIFPHRHQGLLLCDFLHKFFIFCNIILMEVTWCLIMVSFAFLNKLLTLSLFHVVICIYYHLCIREVSRVLSLL